MSGQLKNISFKKVSVSVLSIEHFSRVLIQWELAPTAQNLSNLKFFIDRGESPNELYQLNARPISALGVLEYVDETADLRDINKNYYWRVRAVEYKGDVPVKMFLSEPTNWESDLDLEGLYVVEEHLFLHRHVTGVPAMIFKRRRDGTYCPNCWDKVLKRVTRSNCTTCFGTGRLGGYYPPIDAWMSFEPDPKLEQVVDWGRKQSSQLDIQFTNYPLLAPGDVILEVQPHRFYQVSNVRAPEKSRNTMLQIARLDAVYTSDVEYKLEIPEDRCRILLKQLDDRERGIDFPDEAESAPEDSFFSADAVGDVAAGSSSSSEGMGSGMGIVGPRGPQGAIGPQGPQGIPGSQIYAGDGAPDDSLGVDGDIYVDTSNGDFYKKASGSWD